MMAEVRFGAHLYAICTLSASTYEVQLRASFDSEVLLETHLCAFGITNTVQNQHVRKSFRMCASTRTSVSGSEF